MIHRILKGLAPLAALAGAALVTGCDNMNIHIGDDDGVPLAELDMSGAAPTEPVYIYRLFYEDTVERVMIDRSQWRRELGNEAVPVSSRDADDLKRALSIRPGGEN